MRAQVSDTNGTKDSPSLFTPGESKVGTFSR